MHNKERENRKENKQVKVQRVCRKCGEVNEIDSSNLIRADVYDEEHTIKSCIVIASVVESVMWRRLTTQRH